jgi:Telomere regulation protein Stn1
MSKPGPPGSPGPQPITDQNLTFYPAYCYTASPTYFTWVKLTAFDIHHALATRRGFEGQNLYFYLNHPVQFVYVVGVVVAYEDFHEKAWSMVVDDSSGATIEVTCPKAEQRRAVAPDGAGGAEATPSDGQLKINAAKFAEEQARAAILASVDVGSVVKVRGKIGRFHNTRRIHLERIAVVADTNAEMHFWDERIKLKTHVLSKPWGLSVKEQSALLKLAKGRAEDERGAIRKRRERDVVVHARERRHTQRIAKRYRRDEVKRGVAAELARKAGKSLMADLAMKKDISARRVNGTPTPEP